MKASTAGSPSDLMQGKLDGWVFHITRFVLLFLFRVFFRIRIEGLRNIPREGGVLVVSNHLHNADPVILSVAFPRPMHYMAKKELMSVPVVGQVLRYGGAFPVDRGKADRHAIVMATDRLKQGIAVGMFPEGTRSVSRQIERALPGAGLIALRGNALILPAAIVGSERLPFNGDKQLHERTREPWRVSVIFGEPFAIPMRPDGKRMSPEEAIDLAMTRVASLLPESYRGIYGDSENSPQ